MQILNIAGYKFVTLCDLSALREHFKICCSELGLKGTILLGEEGINIMLAGSEPAVDTFKAELQKDERFSDIRFKETLSADVPFKKLFIKLKKEIIPLGMENIQPACSTAPRISPATFKQWLDEERDMIVLDTRNDYEISFGTFETAVHIDLKHFRDFGQAIEKLSSEWKSKTIVTLCTGGIRCEKASALLMEKGFNEVYQLDGGILQYFEEVGGKHFKGTCYVFDQRETVAPPHA
jgi:UPF0176 protein